MAKISLDTIMSGFSLTKINSNFTKIAAALNDKILWRNNPEGEANALITDVDANGKRVYNLPAPLSEGEPVRLGDISYDDTFVSLALQLASTSGAGMIGWAQSATGAQPRSVDDVLSERVSLFDFLTEAQIADVKAGTALIDVSVGVQAWVNAIQSDVQYGAPKGWAPPGRYRLGTAIQFTKQYVNIEGAGMFSTQFYVPGATDGFKCQGLTYWRPTLKDFSIIGEASSLHAMNMSGTGTIYNSNITNVYLVSGGSSFYGGPTTIVFSVEVVNLIGGSYSGHFIHTNNGPSANYRGCYGFFAGAGKALYRMAGNVHLDGCNGGNAPGYDWWGVFGNDTASADGFQTDFATTDYADVNLEGCNVEYYASRAAGVGGALRFQTQLRGFRFEGGKIDRAALSTGYEAIIYARAGMNGDNTPFVLEPAWFQPGPGTASVAVLYCANSGGHFMDGNGQLATMGVTTCRIGANTFPTLKCTMVGDIYLGTAIQHSALSPRRLSIQTQRYKLGAVLTPVGAGQTIDVTGVTKAIVSPAAAASITKATFTATAGADLDYGRNGELVIEAGNANLTVNHTARGGAADTFILTGGVNLPLVAGQIVRFVRSETNSQWQQV